MRLIKINYYVFKKKSKYYIFLFKWFLIGKFHCQNAIKNKIVFYFLHKALLFILAICFTFGLHDILEYIFLD